MTRHPTSKGGKKRFVAQGGRRCLLHAVCSHCVLSHSVFLWTQQCRVGRAGLQSVWGSLMLMDYTLQSALCLDWELTIPHLIRQSKIISWNQFAHERYEDILRYKRSFGAPLSVTVLPHKGFCCFHFSRHFPYSATPLPYTRSFGAPLSVTVLAHKGFCRFPVSRHFPYSATPLPYTRSFGAPCP